MYQGVVAGYQLLLRHKFFTHSLFRGKILFDKYLEFFIAREGRFLHMDGGFQILSTLEFEG